MENVFLAQESIQTNKRKRKIFIAGLIVYVCLIAFISIGFATDESFDLSDYTTVKLIVVLAAMSVFMLISFVVGIINSARPALNGKSLILPFNEDTKEAVGNIIDKEAYDGKFLVDEYIYKFDEGKKPYGQRVILTPSYLLSSNGMGKITAIPRSKIYWLCAQVGMKGRSSFIVRLLIFTEKRCFYIEGADVEHVQKIAEKLYQYIPNVFSNYESFFLPYEMDKLFEKNRSEFLRLYESAKAETET